MEYVRTIALASNAPLLAVCDSNESLTVEIWNTKLKALQSRMSGLPPSFRVSLSPDGKILALVSSDSVTFWDTGTWRQLPSLSDPIKNPRDIAWSADGRFVAIGGDSVRIWEVHSRRVVRSLDGTGNVAFSADGRMVATAGDNDARVFDVNTGKRLRIFRDKAGVWGPVAISPDGKMLATGGDFPVFDPGPPPRDENGQEYAPSEAFYFHQMKIKIWRLHTGKLVRVLPGSYSNQTDSTSDLQFTPDGRRLFSCGDDYSAIWNLRTGKAVMRFEITGYHDCSMSVDGTTVVAPFHASDPATGRSVLKIFDAQTRRPKWELIFAKPKLHPIRIHTPWLRGL